MANLPWLRKLFSKKDTVKHEIKLTYDADIFDAIEFGDLETIQSFWQEDIDIDYQEKGRNSMLMLAVSYGYEEIVSFLLTKQPDLFLRNDRGQQAVDISKANGQTQVVDLICRHYLIALKKNSRLHNF